MIRSHAGQRIIGSHALTWERKLAMRASDDRADPA
jgi:hypothetical protein